jgi:diguanylate cyclase (GGDEF)-like protein
MVGVGMATTAGTTAASPGRRRRATLVASWAVAPLLVLVTSLVPTDRPEGAIAFASGLSVLEAVGLLLSVRLGLHRRLPRRIRRAWRWIAVAFVIHLLVGAFYGAAAAVGGQAGENWSLAAYGVRLLLIVSLCGAALAFRQPGRAPHELGLLVDTLMLAGSTQLTCWYVVVGPAISRGFEGLGDVLALIPLADVLFLASVSYVLVRGVRESARRTLVFLTVGVAFLTVPDLSIAQRAVDERMASAEGPMLGMVMAGIYLMVLAGIHQVVTAPRPHERQTRRWSSETPHSMTVVPYVAVMLGFLLLLVAAAQSPFYPWGGLVVGTVVMTGGVVVRQVLHLRETQRLATVDPVTGLSNRASLRQGLERAQDRAGRTGRPAAVLLFDLDGFKAVNDTLGHAAGDEALVAFGAVLRRNVLGADVVARLGGDEFAVVLNEVRGPQDAVVVAERILADLCEPVALAGVLHRLRTSVGIALTFGADGPRDVLHRADLAMYEAKRGSGSAWRVHVPDGSDEADPAPVPIPSEAEA